MSSESPVQVTVEDHLLTIRINRPEVRNAFDWQTLELLEGAFARLEADDDLWFGVLTATGAEAFCAGADLKTLPAESAARRREGINPPDTIMHGQRVSKPLICAVNGVAYGGGVELAIACDMRIAAAHASFALPEAQVGMIPAGGATYRLPGLIGEGRALQMMLTGKAVDSTTALEWGLVDQVVASEDLPRATAELVDQLRRSAPMSARTIKRLVAAGRHLTRGEAIRAEAEALMAVQTSADAAEGLAAFREKRPPQWSGV